MIDGNQYDDGQAKKQRLRSVQHVVVGDTYIIKGLTGHAELNGASVRITGRLKEGEEKTGEERWKVEFVDDKGAADPNRDFSVAVRAKDLAALSPYYEVATTADGDSEHAAARASIRKSQQRGMAAQRESREQATAASKKKSKRLSRLAGAKQPEAAGTKQPAGPARSAGRWSRA